LVVFSLMHVEEASAFLLPSASQNVPRSILAAPPLLQQQQQRDVTQQTRESATLFAVTSSSDSNNGETAAKKKVAVLVCPAQFCVPADYACLEEQLRRLVPELQTFIVAPLPRTEWIKVAQQLPTVAFVQAKLPVLETLSWYFDAIEQGLSEIFASSDSEDGGDVSICIIGHSIGGWVARAYLGGLALSSTAAHQLALQRVSSLVTLGTPHTSPDTALVDQTRGLLAAIAASPSCHPQALIDAIGLDITCVCGSGVRGKFWTTNLEEIVAASSYLPLTGKVNDVEGDGIVPLDLAFLEAPARRVELATCTITQQPIRHCHVVPTPWNLWNGYQASIGLASKDFPSYVSEGVVHQWAQYVR
jgi:hypothetical protein